MANIEMNVLKVGDSEFEIADAQARQDVSTLKDDLYNTLVTDTASGAIASFSDGADGVPVKSLSVAIEPVQDLHGYDHPWPAGGGKNLIQYPYYTQDGTFDGVTWAIADDGKVTGTGTTTTGTNFFLMRDVPIPAGTYTISIVGRHIGTTFLIYDDVNSAVLASISPGSADAKQTFTISEPKTVRCYFNIGGTGVTVNVGVYVQLEAGSTATDYAPYSNICPISGHTQAKVTRTGKNVLNPVAKLASFWAPAVGTHINPLTTNYASFSNDTITVDAPWWSGNGFVSNPLVEGKKYKITGTINADSPRCSFVVTDADMNVTRAINNLSESGSINFSATIASGEKYIAVSLINSSNNRGVTFANPCISEDDTYEPYNGQEYTIDLGGTVYGGTLDVTTGVLTVDMAMVDMGALGWTVSNIAVTGVKEFVSPTIQNSVKKPANNGTVANIVCENYKTVAAQNTWTGVIGIAIRADGCVLCDNTTHYADASAFKTAMSGVQLAYEIAHPFTVQLTANNIKTLLGTNNIWSDAGDVEVEYRADTKLYIEKLTAPTEDDMIADHAISANTFFMIGNTLYRATTAIASGATITVGTNAIKLSLSDALNALS